MATREDGKRDSDLEKEFAKSETKLKVGKIKKKLTKKQRREKIMLSLIKLMITCPRYHNSDHEQIFKNANYLCMKIMVETSKKPK